MPKNLKLSYIAVIVIEFLHRTRVQKYGALSVLAQAIVKCDQPLTVKGFGYYETLSVGQLLRH